MNYLKCATHEYVDTEITCDNCSKAICGKCLKQKDNKRLCSLCYIKAITKKTIKESKDKEEKTEEKAKTPFSTKTFDIDAGRLQSFIKNAQEKQEQAKEDKKASQEKEKKVERKKVEEKVYCNWHKRVIAGYTCSKCKINLCRECIGQKQHKDVYCKTCWSTIKYADVLAKKKKNNI